MCLGLGLHLVCTKQLLLQARQLLVKNTLGRGLSRDLCDSFGLGLHLVCTKQLLLQARQLLVNTTLGLDLCVLVLVSILSAPNNFFCKPVHFL